MQKRHKRRNENGVEARIRKEKDKLKIEKKKKS